MLRRMLVVGVMVCVVSQAALAQQAPNASEQETKETSSYWGEAGYGSVCVLANVLYMPAKVVYATVGIITGGLAYLLTAGDSDTAERIWSPSLGGNYVVTPAMVRGDEPILFNGPSYSSD
jgi:hypothetical protein